MLNAAPTQIGAQVVDAIAAIRALLGAFRRRVGRAADLERRGVARLRARSFEAHAPAAFPTERNTAEEQALLDAFGVFKSLFIHVKVGGKAAELAGELVSPRRQRSTGCCLRSTIGWEGTCVCACACGIMFFVCAYTFVYLPISKYVCLPFNRPTLWPPPPFIIFDSATPSGHARLGTACRGVRSAKQRSTALATASGARGKADTRRRVL